MTTISSADPQASPSGKGVRAAGRDLDRTRRRARRHGSGGFDAVALWGLLALVGAGFWLAGPFGGAGAAAMGEAAYVSRLVLHAWVGDLDSVARFFDLSGRLEPSSLGHWLAAVAAGVVGAERAGAIFLTLLTLLLAGLAVAFAARRTGGRATGWALAAAAVLVPAGTVAGPLGVGEALGFVLLAAVLVLWSDRNGIGDIVGAGGAALLLALMVLAFAPVFVVAAAALLLLVLADGVRRAAAGGAVPAVRATALQLAALALATVPALVLCGLFARAHAPDWQALLALVSDPAAGPVLAAQAASGKTGELAVLTLAIGVYGAVVCGLARLIDGPWRREDGLAVAAVALWAVVLLAPWGGLDTGVGRALAGTAWLVSALWCGTVGVSLVVRGPALCALVVAGGLMAGGALALREETAPARAEAETLAALLVRDERVMSLALGEAGHAREGLLLAAGRAGALELTLPSVTAGPEARLLSGNPPLRFAAGMSPAEIAGRDPAAHPLQVLPVGWAPPEPRRAVQMLAVLGTPDADAAPAVRALGLRIAPYYEPVYRSAGGGQIALYSLREPGSWPGADADAGTGAAAGNGQ